MGININYLYEMKQNDEMILILLMNWAFFLFQIVDLDFYCIHMDHLNIA